MRGPVLIWGCVVLVLLVLLSVLTFSITGSSVVESQGVGGLDSRGNPLIVLVFIGTVFVLFTILIIERRMRERHANI